MNMLVNNIFSSAGLSTLKSAAQGPITGSTPTNAEQAAMKIDPTKSTPVPRSSSGGTVTAADAPRAPGEAAPESAMLRSRADSDTTVPFDGARIAQLRSAIADGSYQPDPARIADALVSMERAIAGDSK